MNTASKQKIQELIDQIADLTRRKTTAWINAIEYYEKHVQEEISKEKLRAVLDIANQAKEALIQALDGKATYEKQYAKSCRLLSASNRDIPLSGIMDCIDKVVVDGSGKIVIKRVKIWHILLATVVFGQPIKSGGIHGKYCV